MVFPWNPQVVEDKKLREITLGAFERYDIPSPIGPMAIAMLDGRRLLMIFHYCPHISCIKRLLRTSSLVVGLWLPGCCNFMTWWVKGVDTSLLLVVSVYAMIAATKIPLGATSLFVLYVYHVQLQTLKPPCNSSAETHIAHIAPAGDDFFRA